MSAVTGTDFAHPAGTARAADWRDLRVAVADDTRHFRRLMRMMLAAFEIRSVYEAERGDVMLECLAEQEIDILFTDVLLPRMDGLELVSLIRNDPGIACRAMPIVCVTSDARRQTIKRAVRAGADGFLIKPVSAADLYRQIHQQMTDPLPRIEVDGYYGPDRRRGFVGTYIGTERRTGPDADEA